MVRKVCKKMWGVIQKLASDPKTQPQVLRVRDIIGAEYQRLNVEQVTDPDVLVEFIVFFGTAVQALTDLDLPVADHAHLNIDYVDPWSEVHAPKGKKARKATGDTKPDGNPNNDDDPPPPAARAPSAVEKQRGYGEFLVFFTDESWMPTDKTW